MTPPTLCMGLQMMLDIAKHHNKKHMTFQRAITYMVNAWSLMSVSPQINTNAQLVLQSCTTACLRTHLRNVKALA